MARRNSRMKAGNKRSKKERQSKEKRRLFLSLCLLLVALSVMFISWQRNYSGLKEQNVLRPANPKKPLQKSDSDSEDRLAQNLLINGIQISGLDLESAIQAVKRHEKQFTEHEFTFFNSNKELRVSGSELGLKIDEAALREVLKAAIKEGKSGQLKLPFTFSDEGIERVLDKLSRNFSRAAKDASFGAYDPQSNKLSVKEAESGLSFNREAFAAELRERLKKGELEDRIELNLEPSEAEVQAADLKTDFSFLASAYTNIPYYDANRIHNLIVSCEKISGAIVQPGQIYSFMNVMGDFQPGDGWANAGIQSDGVTVSGLGGGICQTSTTLFQAAILAGLDIVEAHNHDLPSDYCELGKDAMVAYGWSDLKIQNNLAGPIKIIAYYSDPSVIFEIYGPAMEPGLSTQLYVEEGGRIKPGPDEKRESPDLKPGESKVFRERSEGYKTTLYRLWLKNGEVIKKDWITSYTYPAFSAIYLVGKKSEESEEESKESEPKWVSPTEYDFDSGRKWQSQEEHNQYLADQYSETPDYSAPPGSLPTSC